MSTGKETGSLLPHCADRTWMGKNLQGCGSSSLGFHNTCWGCEWMPPSCTQGMARPHKSGAKHVLSARGVGFDQIVKPDHRDARLLPCTAPQKLACPKWPAGQMRHGRFWPRCRGASETFSLRILPASRRYPRLAKQLPRND